MSDSSKRINSMSDSSKRINRRKRGKDFIRDWRLYVFILPAVVYTALFCYKPMYGILIAFKKYSIRKGILGSPWVGFDNFKRIFSSYWFPYILRNTVVISGLDLLICFPLPIILALLLNELRSAKFRGTVQTVSYAPHFISTVVMCGMVSMFLSPSTGIINRLIVALGGEKVAFLQIPSAFKWIMTLSGVWQSVGWGSIIYFAALAGVDRSLLEAAEVDGASRMQKIWHINIPEILPTTIMMFILRCGSILSVGYEKVYLLQNDLNLTSSEVISTYVYKVGLEQSDFAYSTAVGLFNTVVNCIFILSANAISKKVAKVGLFS